MCKRNGGKCSRTNESDIGISFTGVAGPDEQKVNRRERFIGISIKGRSQVEN